MYYIIETKYVGPNQDQYVDANRIEITTVPAVTNSSRETCLDGWCGTTNDWAIFARGQYDSVDEARAAIAEIFGDVRDRDANGDPFESDEEHVVEIYRPGRWEPMSVEVTGEFFHDDIESVGADWTDDQIAELIDDCIAAAHDQGMEPDRHELVVAMESRREEARDEA